MPIVHGLDPLASRQPMILEDKPVPGVATDKGRWIY